MRGVQVVRLCGRAVVTLGPSDGVLQRGQRRVVMHPIRTYGALSRTELTVNGLVVVKPTQHHVDHVLPQIIGIAQDVREQGVESDENGRVEHREEHASGAGFDREVSSEVLVVGHAQCRAVSGGVDDKSVLPVSARDVSLRGDCDERTLA